MYFFPYPLDGKKVVAETKNVTSRNHSPANVTNIGMQVRQEAGSEQHARRDWGVTVK